MPLSNNNDSHSEQLGFRRIGVIVAPQGLQGEVRVKPYNENPDWAQNLKEVAVMPSEIADVPTGFLKVLSAKPKETIVLMRFEGVSSRTEAEKLVGQCLVLYAHQLPKLSQDEYYVDTLKGLAVMSQDSQIQLGVVNDMLSATAGEYLEIIPISGRFEDAVVVPFHEPFIHKVLMVEKQVWLAGLDAMFNGDLDKNVAGTES